MDFSAWLVIWISSFPFRLFSFFFKMEVYCYISISIFTDCLLVSTCSAFVVWVCGCICLHTGPRVHPQWCACVCVCARIHRVQGLRDNLAFQTKRIHFCFRCHFYLSFSAKLHSLHWTSFLDLSRAVFPILLHVFVSFAPSRSVKGLVRGVCGRQCINQTLLVLIYSCPSVTLALSLSPVIAIS